MVIVLLEPNSHDRQFSSSIGTSAVFAPPMVVAAAADSSGGSADTSGIVSPNSAADSMNAVVPRINVERFKFLSSQFCAFGRRSPVYLSLTQPSPNDKDVTSFL